jgi:excisionase family DNA binding protein
LFTADEVAERLGLHVRTVRNYIRDGQLAATRIGKQYRISRTDLAAFTGHPVAEPEPSAPHHAEATSIVEIEGVGPATADRLITSLTGTGSGLHVQTIYQREQARLKVVIVGDLTASAYLFGVINTIVKEPRR